MRFQHNAYTCLLLKRHCGLNDEYLFDNSCCTEGASTVQGRAIVSVPWKEPHTRSRVKIMVKISLVVGKKGWEYPSLHGPTGPLFHRRFFALALAFIRVQLHRHHLRPTIINAETVWLERLISLPHSRFYWSSSVCYSTLTRRIYVPVGLPSGTAYN